MANARQIVSHKSIATNKTIQRGYPDYSGQTDVAAAMLVFNGMQQAASHTAQYNTIQNNAFPIIKGNAWIGHLFNGRLPGS